MAFCRNFATTRRLASSSFFPRVSFYKGTKIVDLKRQKKQQCTPTHHVETKIALSTSGKRSGMHPLI